jgi:hypothetical protein
MRLTAFQKRIIEMLRQNKHMHILIVYDYMDLTERVSVSDDDLNDYISLKISTAASLIKKGIIKKYEGFGSLQHTVEKYKLNP